jgi:hypothetical protein
MTDYPGGQALTITEDGNTAMPDLTSYQIKLREIEQVATSRQPNLSKIKRILKIIRG